MKNKYFDPEMKIEFFDTEKIVASDYIAQVQEYINNSSESIKRRIELFQELLQYNE